MSVVNAGLTTDQRVAIHGFMTDYMDGLMTLGELLDAVQATQDFGVIQPMLGIDQGAGGPMASDRRERGSHGLEPELGQ